MFGSIFDSATSMTDTNIICCTIVSLVCGIVIAIAYSCDKRHSKSLMAALVVLPVIVQAVIMMVNGNLGVGVAVMGAFSLIRFRSVPGSAKDITFIFLTMAAGLANGVGCIVFAIVITIFLCAVIFVIHKLITGRSAETERLLRITIPENLDYTGVFEDVFKEHTSASELMRVKTINMGTMYELRYSITLKSIEAEKKMIDEIRCRNGNLTVVCGKAGDEEAVL